MARTTSELRRLWSPPCTGPWARVTLHGGATVTVRPAIVDALRALDACMIAAGYKATPPDCGAYNCRPITGGTAYSLHAYGIAVDINWQANPYGRRLVTDMPAGMIAAIEALRTRSGAVVFRWGGRYSGNKDAMHFEVVASPAELAAGIGPAPKPAPHPFTLAMLNITRAHNGLPPATAATFAQSVGEFQALYNETFDGDLDVDRIAGPETCKAIGDCVRMIMAAA